MDEGTVCLCGSGQIYDLCCGLYHSGKKYPDTAETLMRSRFTAFALHNKAYLLSTWEVSKRPSTVDFSKSEIKWSRLDIVKCKKGGSGDKKGLVQFKAYYSQRGEEYILNETSRFRKVRGRWYYLDGMVNSIASGA